MEVYIFVFFCVCASAKGTSDIVPGSQLQVAINHAIANDLPSVSVPAGGNYDFSSTNSSLLIFGARSLTIASAHPSTSHGVGRNMLPTTTLWFSCGKGVHVDASIDVVLQGFIIDYKSACFAQGTLVRAVTPTSVDVQFDGVNFPLPVGPMFPLPRPPPKSGPPASGIMCKVTFWDPSTLVMIEHGNHIVANISRVTTATQVSENDGQSQESAGNIFRIDFDMTPLLKHLDSYKGTYVTVHPRLGLSSGTGNPGGLTYLITNSSNVTTQDLNIYGGATEAIVEGGGRGGHVYRRVRLIRREQSTMKHHRSSVMMNPVLNSVSATPTRLLVANADGFHSSCVRVGPTLVDSEISFTGDDALNIHSRMSIVSHGMSYQKYVVGEGSCIKLPETIRYTYPGRLFTLSHTHVYLTVRVIMHPTFS
eukprot:m.490641 g.490641  ORF g.490641 m.490641 type:complete len:421 (-) comp21781_c0_seq5:936-2198(-)